MPFVVSPFGRRVGWLSLSVLLPAGRRPRWKPHSIAQLIVCVSMFVAASRSAAKVGATVGRRCNLSCAHSRFNRPWPPATYVVPIPSSIAHGRLQQFVPIPNCIAHGRLQPELSPFQVPLPIAACNVSCPHSRFRSIFRNGLVYVASAQRTTPRHNQHTHARQNTSSF